MDSNTSASASFYDFLGWLEANRKTIGIGLAVVVIAIFAVTAYRWFVEQTEAKANAALLKLEDPGRQQADAKATAEELLAVANEYPRTSAGERAHYLAGARLFDEGKYSEAEELFRSFLEKHTAGNFAAQATFGQAAAAEAQGKLPEALAGYQNVASRYQNQPIAVEARFAMARVNELMGKPEQAVEIYGSLAEMTPASPRTSEAGVRREELLKKHPELARERATSEGRGGGEMEATGDVPALLPQETVGPEGVETGGEPE